MPGKHAGGGCGCCGPVGCTYCEPGTTPAEVTVTIAGWGHAGAGVCSSGDCDVMNDSFVLPKQYEDAWCTWVDGFTPSAGCTCLSSVQITSQVTIISGTYYVQTTISSGCIIGMDYYLLTAVYRLSLGTEAPLDCSAIGGEQALISENYYLAGCTLTGSTCTLAVTG